MVMPIIEVVESMVTALFICYAYNADVLMLNDPVLYQEITKAYDIMCADMRGDFADDEVEEWNEEDEEWDEEEDDYYEEKKPKKGKGGKELEEESSSGEEG